MALATATLATIGAIAAATTATAAVGTGIYSVSRGISAKKKAKGQAEQAERIRTAEKKKAALLVTEAEALPAKAKKTAAIAAGKKRRRRGTLATGPRGLLTEPDVLKPTLGA